MRRIVLLLGLCSIIAQGALAQSRLAKPKIDTLKGGIVRVMNSGPTAWVDTSGWKLVLERTVQPPDGSPGMLESPAGILLLNDGRLLEWESKPAAIRIYDAQGRFRIMLGREGDGPGEYRAPFPVVARDTLVIHDPQILRGTVMTLDGKVVRSFPTTCCNWNPPTLDDRGRLRVATLEMIRGVGKTSWLYLDLTGKHIDSVVQPVAMIPHVWTSVTTFPNGQVSGSSSGPVLFAGVNSYGFLRNGSAVYGGTDRFEFLLTSNGRDTTRIFGRTGVPAHPIASAFRDSAFRWLTDRNAGIKKIASLSDVPNVFPMWNTISEDGSGNLWIMTGGDYHRPVGNYTVFSPDGRFLGEVAAPFTSARATSWSRDHLAVYDTDDNDLPRILIYRIDRRGH